MATKVPGTLATWDLFFNHNTKSCLQSLVLEVNDFHWLHISFYLREWSMCWIIYILNNGTNVLNWFYLLLSILWDHDFVSNCFIIYWFSMDQILNHSTTNSERHIWHNWANSTCWLVTSSLQRYTTPATNMKRIYKCMYFRVSRKSMHLLSNHWLCIISIKPVPYRQQRSLTVHI